MELFRTERKEEDKGGLPGKRESVEERGTGMYANSKGVSCAIRGCGKNAPLLICCYFHLAESLETSLLGLPDSGRSSGHLLWCLTSALQRQRHLNLLRMSIFT